MLRSLWQSLPCGACVPAPSLWPSPHRCFPFPGLCALLTQRGGFFSQVRVVRGLGSDRRRCDSGGREPGSRAVHPHGCALPFSIDFEFAVGHGGHSQCLASSSWVSPLSGGVMLCLSAWASESGLGRTGALLLTGCSLSLWGGGARPLTCGVRSTSCPRGESTIHVCPPCGTLGHVIGV